MRETYNIKFKDIIETIIIIYVLIFFKSYLSCEQITNLISNRAFLVNGEGVLEYLSLHKGNSILEYKEGQKNYQKNNNQILSTDYINSTFEYRYNIKFSKIDINNYIIIFVNLTIFSIIYTIYNRSRKKYIAI